jgi:hypothetical protein
MNKKCCLSSSHRLIIYNTTESVVRTGTAPVAWSFASQHHPRVTFTLPDYTDGNEILVSKTFSHHPSCINF